MTIVGRNTQILPDTQLVQKQRIVIGDNCVIGPSVVLGTPPQHFDYYHLNKFDPDLVIRIGNNVIIREFTNVNFPTENRDTVIEDNCFIMSHCHIAHDCQLAKNVVMATGVHLAGHTTILEGASFGLNVCIHQYSTIGAYSMIGMGSIVVKDIPPFLVFVNDLKCYKVNHIGMGRAGFSVQEINEIAQYYDNNEDIKSLRLKRYLDEFYHKRSQNRTIETVRFF